MATMDKKEMKRDCVKNGMYSTPAINDKLYLHYKGYSKIENLEEYTGVKALWLEGNGFSKIEGLDNQTEVRSLYLHENCIDKIENLEAQVNVDTLNLSKNFITKIENLSHMTQMTSLNLAHNKISTAEGVREYKGLCLDGYFSVWFRLICVLSVSLQSLDLALSRIQFSIAFHISIILIIAHLSTPKSLLNTGATPSRDSFSSVRRSTT